MVKPTDAELVAEFAGTADRVRDVGQTPSKIVVKVDIYTTALGTLRVTVNREIKTDFALLYDPSMWKQVNLKGRSWFRETLRSEEHTSELQSLMRISYAVFCLKKKHTTTQYKQQYH